MKLSIPSPSLVVLIGPSGSGKTTFARAHFDATEILTPCDAGSVYEVASERLTAGRLTVIDAANAEADARQCSIEVARACHATTVAIVFRISTEHCAARNRERKDGQRLRTIRHQRSQLDLALRKLRTEGFRQVYVLESTEDVKVERVRLQNDQRTERGPFDIIGDIHGCADELEELLGKLDYTACDTDDVRAGWSELCYRHPAGRRVIFVGDLADRGPRSRDVLSLARNMVVSGRAFCVLGNHDAKLLRKLRGHRIREGRGLEMTLAELDQVPAELQPLFRKQLREFLAGLPSHTVLDEGRLVVAHAGLKEEMHGRSGGMVRAFALYGDTTGATDRYGLPIRGDWAADYRGSATVVYGHTPVPRAEWRNSTINIDTGCVFGGKLTAVRYPEGELISVAARRTYYQSPRPFPVG